MTFGASGAPGGARQGGGREGRREGRRGGGTRGAAAEKLCSSISPAQLRRPSSPGRRCALPLPSSPPSCDKRRRERAEPTFTTAGTSEASLLNPVSNGDQHRASNVIRPAAAAATSLRGEPGARARGQAGGRAPCSPCSRATPRGSAGQREPGLPPPPSPGPARERDSVPVRVPRRCWRCAPTLASGKGPWRPRASRSCGNPRSPAPRSAGAGWRWMWIDLKPKMYMDRSKTEGLSSLCPHSPGCPPDTVVIASGT